MGAQLKMKFGIDTAGPEKDPSVEETRIRSIASSPEVEVLMKGFSGNRPHVLLLQPGLAGALQVLQLCELAKEHCAELHRAGR